ncbi:MAG TPA: hypothetical protein EYO88_02845 [Alphaproteobacteria bacterium]|nr:hypothetical protein [Alphaproteobacteria bacterium]
MFAIKTIGDAYMCVGGISEQRNSHAKNVCVAAAASACMW